MPSAYDEQLGTSQKEQSEQTAAPSKKEQLKQKLARMSFEEQEELIRPEGDEEKSGGDEKKGKGGFWGKLGKMGKEAWKGLKKVANPKELIYQAILDDEDRLPRVLEATKDIPNQDIIYDQLAHRAAYSEIDPETLAGWGYVKYTEVSDESSGFRAVLLMPTEEVKEGKSAAAQAILKKHQRPVVPVVAFRGTKNMKGVEDDFNREGVGTFQFSTHEGQIKEILSAAGGKADIVGHSLGGALAQLCAVRLPSGVRRVVTFQSPALNDKDANKLKERNEEVDEDEQIHSTHYRAVGDIVHLGGEQLTEGDVYTFDKVGVGNAMEHTVPQLSHLNAARGHAVEGVGESKEQRKGRDRLTDVEKTTAASERDALGLFLGRAFRSIATSIDKGGSKGNRSQMDDYARLWETIKEAAEKGDYPMGHLLEMIDLAPAISEPEKGRMKANLLHLYS